MTEPIRTGRYLVTADATFKLELVIAADSEEDALRKAAEMKYYTSEPGFSGWLIQDMEKGSLNLKWAQETYQWGTP